MRRKSSLPVSDRAQPSFGLSARCAAAPGLLSDLRRRLGDAHEGLPARAASPTGEAPQPARAPSWPYRPWQPQARLPQRLRSCSARNSAHDSPAWESQSTPADLLSSATVAKSDPRRHGADCTTTTAFAGPMIPSPSERGAGRAPLSEEDGLRRGSGRRLPRGRIENQPTRDGVREVEHAVDAPRERIE